MMMRARKIIFKVLTTILLIFFTLFMSAITMFTIQGYYMHKSATDEISPLQMAEIIRDDNYVTIDELPEFYINAVICSEDRRFYSHCGVDFLSIIRAAFYDIKNMSFEQGGSTITQQLAKNFYYTQEKRIERKFAELFTAIQIEKELSKDEIFELYVNSIYFGEGYYGIYEAANGYYGKNPSELTDSECAMLAGIPNAPSAYSPREDSELAKQRMKQVLDCVVECGVITDEQAVSILKS